MTLVVRDGKRNHVVWYRKDCLSRASCTAMRKSKRSLESIVVLPTQLSFPAQAHQARQDSHVRRDGSFFRILCAKSSSKTNAKHHDHKTLDLRCGEVEMELVLLPQEEMDTRRSST